MIAIVSLECPVCGAPFAPGADRCAYCGSILVLQTDHPRIDPSTLNRAVVNERIAGFRETLRRDPNDVAAHYGLGVAYYNLGLTEAAIDELGEACRLTPENPHIHTQLAVAYREEARGGDPRAREEMEDHIQYALRLDPDNVEAMLLRAEMSLEGERYDEAVGHLERAYALEPKRARDKLRDALVASIRQRERAGLSVDGQRARLREIDPSSGSGEPAQIDVPQVVASAADPGGAAQPHATGLVGTRLKGAVKGFFIGIGVGFVALIVLAPISSAFEKDSGPYDVVAVLAAISFFMPLVFAIRGWYVAKR